MIEREIREKSREILLKMFDVSVSETLPLININIRNLSAEEVCCRMFSIQAVTALSYDFNNRFDLINKWIEVNTENIKLSQEEKKFLKGEYTDQKLVDFQFDVECIFTLMWYLKKENRLDIDLKIPENLISFLPRISELENVQYFINSCNEKRDNYQLLEKIDLYYCFHNLLNSNLIEVDVNSNNQYHQIVVKRRKALEWLAYGRDWDINEIDT